MSQIEPYGYSQMPPDDDDDFEPMQMRGGSGWQPGPPQRPPFGPSPGGGGWPFWGYWGFRMRSAWRDIKFLQKLLHDIIGEMISDGLVAPGPNSPVQGPSGGVKGVTDGSDAGPGQVGEFISTQVVIPFPAYPGVVSTTVSSLVVQPGDWQLWAWMAPSTKVGSNGFYLAPQPSGVSNSMTGLVHVTGAEVIGIQAISPQARGSFSVPTLLAFHVDIDNSAATAAVAGTATLFVQGRRMR